MIAAPLLALTGAAPAHAAPVYPFCTVTGGPETTAPVINGTSGPDTIVCRSATGEPQTATINLLGGNDTFRYQDQLIPSEWTINGRDGDDRFLGNGHAVFPSKYDATVNTGNGNDTFAIHNRWGQVSTGSGNDTVTGNNEKAGAFSELEG